MQKARCQFVSIEAEEENPMDLYYKAGACSLAPHIVAVEAGLPLNTISVDLGTKKDANGGDYLAVNPKGYVPALRTDAGVVLTEVGAILQYLGDINPNAGLMPPAGTAARVKQQEWLFFISTEIHKGMGAFFNPMMTPDWRKGVEATLGRRLAWLEKELGDGPYLSGETFTAADAYLFVVLNWAKIAGYDLDKFPKLVAFRKRVSERPKVQAALKAEGLI